MTGLGSVLVTLFPIPLAGNLACHPRLLLLSPQVAEVTVDIPNFGDLQYNKDKSLCLLPKVKIQCFF